MADHTFLRTAVQVLDNAVVTEFFTSSAGVFHQAGFLNKRDTDSFRMILRDIQNTAEKRSEPVLQILIDQDAEFLSQLLSRYGIARLNSNLFRYSTRGVIQELIKDLSQWGQELLPQAYQAFNRPFYLYEGRECDSRTLYSAVIMEFARSLKQSCDLLWQADHLGKYYFPHSMAVASDGDFILDRKLSEGLLFEDLCLDPFPGLSDSKMIRCVIRALECFTDTFHELLSQMEEQSDSFRHLSSLQVKNHWIRRESPGLLLSISGKSHLIAGETRRQIYLSRVHDINAQIRSMKLLFTDLLREHQNESFSSAKGRLGKDVERRISSQMMSGGVGAKNADLATKDLFEFMAKNTVKPQELLLGELNKINPTLTPESLETLRQFLSQESLAKATLAEKKRVLMDSQDLKKGFEANLQKIGRSVALVLCLFMVLVGCGLKMNPKNDEPDLRPDIPFRGEPAYESTSWHQEVPGAENHKLEPGNDSEKAGARKASQPVIDPNTGDMINAK